MIRCRKTRCPKTRCLKKPERLRAASRLSASAWWSSPASTNTFMRSIERTPKEDTIKETEKRKVEVKRKGKLVTVTRSFTKLVDNDFTWKDPNAAERVGMSMSDYVIGGMDKSFKLKLFRMLQAAENAGLQPGITSAFRDDYRQVDRKRPESGKQPVVSRRQPPRRLWPRACRRYRQRQRRRSRPALEFDRSALEMGRCERKTVRDRPTVSPLRSTACRPDRRPGICLPPRRDADGSADVKKRQKQVAQARHGTAKPQVAATSSTGKPHGRLAAAR